MLSIAEIAKRDGVSKPAISRKVKQLVDQHGLVVERDGQGRVSAVNVAQFDELRGRYGDPSKAQATAAASSTASVKSSETYDEGLRQKIWIDAERARIRLAQDKGELVEAAELAAALSECGGAITRVVDRLLSHCDEMAAAVGKDGVHGLRVLVKKISFDLKTEIADALESVAVNSKRGHTGAGTEASA
ncbi:helix-turn-helix domain-containing protein [Bradyrhizobium sp. Arg237L]|uniref:MarR family transcriptional regulator n=1 Tax=Bradyrhizobium sp. Arg237L TaxID=3003352 RepID=UPI00249DF595|nr:helix-turn-helix domain-containing protein [Bradyrhizobium sp. Arg237L]MDI4231435.1 helix-turn-helix domain-containing protein [Bradyrhizobium sp. Arg237L]